MGTAFEALADLITGLGPELSNQPRARELGDKLVRMARAQRAAITTAPAIIIEFIKLLKSFVREVGPPSSTADFCARVNGMITLIVREITGADCVFIRRLNSDGSVELLGEPKWYDGQEVGRPPRIKFKDEGVSARILNRADPCPVVIWNIHAPDTEDAIRTSHRQMLDRNLTAMGGDQRSGVARLDRMSDVSTASRHPSGWSLSLRLSLQDRDAV